LHAVDDAAQVHVQNAIPILQLIVPDFARNADACVVEDVIQAALALERVLNQTVGRGEVDDVKELGGCLAAVLPDAGSDFLGQLDLPVSEHDPRSPSGQRFTQRPANTGSPARDQGNSPVVSPQRVGGFHGKGISPLAASMTTSAKAERRRRGDILVSIAGWPVGISWPRQLFFDLPPWLAFMYKRGQPNAIRFWSPKKEPGWRAMQQRVSAW
jgi:hypothetical protein